MKLLKKIGNIYLRVIALSLDYPYEQMNFINKTWRSYLRDFGILTKKPWSCMVRLFSSQKQFSQINKWKSWRSLSMPSRETWRYLQSVDSWTALDLYLCGQQVTKTF